MTDPVIDLSRYLTALHSLKSSDLEEDGEVRVSDLATEYQFVLPTGYLDRNGTLHRRGIMRMATARDELEPLRDPTISGPDDPRLTILVLSRVVESLGTLTEVTPEVLEDLLASDLAYLQDFYGVINFGSADDIAAWLRCDATAPDRTDR